MTTNLPDLSTWNRVPVGATVPKHTPYAYAYEDSVTVELDGNFEDFMRDGDGDYTYYTERPIAPPLPTEEGATILVSGDERPPRILLTRLGGCWVNQYVVEWPVDRIHAWAPVTIGETVVARP